MTNLFKVSYVEIEIPTSYAAQIKKDYVRCLNAQTAQRHPTPSYMQPVRLPVNAQEDMYWTNPPHLSIPMYVPTRQHFSQHLVRFTYKAYATRQTRLDLFQWHKWFKSEFANNHKDSWLFGARQWEFDDSW